MQIYVTDQDAHVMVIGSGQNDEVIDLMNILTLVLFYFIHGLKKLWKRCYQNVKLLNETRCISASVPVPVESTILCLCGA